MVWSIYNTYWFLGIGQFFNHGLKRVLSINAMGWWNQQRFNLGEYLLMPASILIFFGEFFLKVGTI